VNLDPILFADLCAFIALGSVMLWWLRTQNETPRLEHMLVLFGAVVALLLL
jgi:hypothetical protein